MTQIFKNRKRNLNKSTPDYLVSAKLDAESKRIWKHLPDKSQWLREQLKFRFCKRLDEKKEIILISEELMQLRLEQEKESKRVSDYYNSLIDSKKKRVAELNIILQEEKVQMKLDEITK